MMYNSDDSCATPSASVEDMLKAISKEGDKFVSKETEHPDGITGGYRQDLLSLRKAARGWLKEQHNPLAIWRVFEATYEDVLEVNAWTSELRLRSYDQPTSAGKLLNQLEDALSMPLLMPKDFLERRLAAYLEDRSYNPVKRYIQQLPLLTPQDWEPWGQLANILFGTSDQLVQVKLYRWLISAVARAMEPGCKADSALVLRGKQGKGKTSFLAALFGDHFRTLHSHTATLEQQRIIQQSWGCELGELEATFRVKDISALKAFLTETSDSYRDLYQNTPTARPRHCVFAGTTNKENFLNDPTGSRRFWVIDVADHKIPVDWVEANRDNIWSVALSLYYSREPWWMTDEELELSERDNQKYQTENSFEEPLRVTLDILEERLEQHIAISSTDASEFILGIKKENHRKHSRDLAAAMEALGYTKKQFRSKALSGWYYVKPGADNPVPFKPSMADLAVEYRNNPPKDRRG